MTPSLPIQTSHMFEGILRRLYTRPMAQQIGGKPSIAWPPDRRPPEEFNSDQLVASMATVCFVARA